MELITIKANSLFQSDLNISSKLLKTGDFTIYYQVKDESKCKCQMQIIDTEGICDVLRLYYGIRCAFTHGHHKKTLTKTLQDFPHDANKLLVYTSGYARTDSDDFVAENLMKLYYNVREYGKDAQVGYVDLVNIWRFLMKCAERLRLALSNWIYVTFNVKVWGLKP